MDFTISDDYFFDYDIASIFGDDVYCFSDDEYHYANYDALDNPEGLFSDATASESDPFEGIEIYDVFQPYLIGPDLDMHNYDLQDRISYVYAMCNGRREAVDLLNESELRRLGFDIAFLPDGEQMSLTRALRNLRPILEQDAEELLVHSALAELDSLRQHVTSMFDLEYPEYPDRPLRDYNTAVNYRTR